METFQAMDFEVHRDGSMHLEGLVSTQIEFQSVGPGCLRMEELDEQGRIQRHDVPFQIDAAFQDATPNLLHFWMDPAQTGLAVRYFRLSPRKTGARPLGCAQKLMIKETVYEGQDAYQIHAGGVTYLLHLESGGLASLVDPEGHDWIQYRTLPGSAGQYRGIPNIKYPDGYLHPGNKNAKCVLISNGPLCCQIYVGSLDGKCEALWLFSSQYVQLSILKTPRPYWFLYEGTPGGAFDEDLNFVVRSNGVRTLASTAWEDLLDPGWLYFGSTTSSRVLFLAQQEVERFPSTYSPMEKNMTVFGFGRIRTVHYLEKCPAQYRMGLLQAGDFETVRRQIEQRLEPFIVKQSLKAGV